VNIGLVAGIAVGALLLILLAAILIWRLVRRLGDSVASLPLEQGTEALGSTEDIDFAAMSYYTNPVEEQPTDIDVVEPDESLTSVKNIADDFL
jgi:hypothetical protein